MSDSSIDRILSDIQSELMAARSKFPSNEHNLAALTEEVGELANAMIEHHRGNLDAQNIWEEAVQVAVMAIRVATEGDSTFSYSPVTREQV